ncbi:MAG TPA: HNH endonuclease signature motif containing protein, partial [Sporichthya sp.]|nr:HNH endonuclease signature motif containing protein [Sporichthya sp.]
TADTLGGDPGADGKRFSRVATGEELDPETVRKICCDAGITPVLLNTLGEPLNVGREHRTVTPAIWAALVARDIGCIGEGCTRPASWCQAHHITWWENGGITAVETCALVCQHEHNLIHHHGWQVRMAQDGHPEMIPPRWVDPDQRPRRNAHWKLIRDGLKTGQIPAPEKDEEPDRGP